MDGLTIMKHESRDVDGERREWAVVLGCDCYFDRSDGGAFHSGSAPSKVLDRNHVKSNTTTRQKHDDDGDFTDATCSSSSFDVTSTAFIELGMVSTVDRVDGSDADSGFDYKSIPSFDDFLDLCNDSHYVRVPSDFCVLVADICGSTACIESGRYRDVNTVGAMCIAVVRNALVAAGTTQQSTSTSKNDEFPYCFGGDGASLVVRADQKEAAVTALLALKSLVKENYKMQLRVGSVPVAYLEENGTSVQVARYEIVKGMSIALFRGGGLALADATVKHGGELQETKASQNMTPNLDGLSCRWQKIPNRNGCVLALLVMSNPGHDDQDSREIYKSILHHLEEILHPNTLKQANPVSPELATYKTLTEMIKDEARMHASCWSLAWIGRLFEISFCYMLFYWGVLQYTFLDVPAYRQATRTHADHRKFDDMLRMVLDCSNEQADQVERYLTDLYNNGRQVFFGTHRSKHTLMTCLLEDTSEGKHIHFVDGDSGGYALAAKQLKLQQQLETMRMCKLVEEQRPP